MEDDDDDDYSSSGSSTRDPNEILHETVPDSQPPRGGHILDRSPIRASNSSTSSRNPLRSTPDRDQARLEEELQRRVQQRQQIVGGSSRSSLPKQGQQQGANSSIQQQQAQQNRTSSVPVDSSLGQQT